MIYVPKMNENPSYFQLRARTMPSVSARHAVPLLPLLQFSYFQFTQERPIRLSEDLRSENNEVENLTELC